MDVTTENFGEVRELIQKKLLPKVAQLPPRPSTLATISSSPVSATKNSKGTTSITCPSKSTKR